MQHRGDRLRFEGIRECANEEAVATQPMGSEKLLLNLQEGKGR